MPDLVERAITTRTVQHRGYDVSILGCSLAQRGEPLRHERLVPPGSHLSHPFSLGLLSGIADFEYLHRGFRLFHEVVHPDDGTSSLLQFGLESGR